MGAATVRSRILSLADQHGVYYQPTSHDALAEVVTLLSEYLTEKFGVDTRTPYSQP